MSDIYQLSTHLFFRFPVFGYGVFISEAKRVCFCRNRKRILCTWKMPGNNQIVEQNSSEFSLHELVFVKMSGYSAWWPSRIIRTEAN